MAADQGKVLTLVFTDLADSTALKTEHGDQAVDALLTRHREHVARLADECAGRIIDWAGDGCFLTFETSSAGVLFGLRLQQTHKQDPDLPGVRVGIHLGEVTEKEGPGGQPQVKGLAVDLAARIQSLAKPGQVLLSAAVYDSARQRIGVDALGQPVLWQTHGAYTLKGFDKPLDIGEAGLEGLSPLSAPEASEKAQPLVMRRPEVEIIPPRSNRRSVMPLVIAAVVVAGVALAAWWSRTRSESDGRADLESPITSIAVLPLDNLSNDPEQEYFADGMAEAITSELAKIKSLKVISRTSAQQYRGSTLSLPDIAAELNVDGLIEGSVLRDGDDVRITVQLIDARTDAHVWSDSYQDTVTSVLKLQSKVALAIADTLRAELTPDERERIADAREVEPEAYEVYLQAINAMTDITPTGLFRVRELFTRATQLDPEFADAWAGIAIANSLLGAFAAGPPRPFLEAAKDAAERALKLDPTLGEAQAVLGMTDVSLGLDWESAHTRFDLARRLNPNSFLVCQLLSVFRMWEGDYLDAQEQADRILELNPYASYPVSEAAMIFVNTGRLSQGLEILKGEVAKNPANIQASLFLSWGLAVDGDYDAAIAQCERTQSTTGSIPTVQAFVAYAKALGGQEDEARAILERLTATTPPEVLGVSGVPWAYFALGDSDTAFEWLERGAAAPAGLYFSSLRSVPFSEEWQRSENLAGVADDPRYWRLIERLGYPPLPPDHPGYADEQAWRERKAAEAEVSAPIKKLAVLPFTNMMNDPDQEYFVDGMTEALITELAQIHAIQVRGRTSIMRYKETDKSIPEIARELDVDGVIEGSVMREGDEVRVTAQLIHAPSDTHRWAESYDSTVTSIFKLHSDMALAIAREVEANLTPQEASRIADVREVIPAAYDQVLLARNAQDRQSLEGFQAVERHARQALAIDPNFPEGYSVLADSLWMPTVWGWGNSAEPIAEVRSLLARARELDSNNAMVLTSTGWIALVYDHDWQTAWDLFQRAVELEPNSFWPRAGLVWCHLTAHEYDAALEEAQRAVSLDPYSAQARDGVGDVYSTMGRTEAAVRYREETLQLFPNHLGTLLDLVHEYPLLDRGADFDRVVDRIVTLSGDAHPWPFANGYGILGRDEKVREIVAEAERAGDAAHAFMVAMGYAELGNADKTFEWLDRAYERRQFTMILMDMRFFPALDPYRDDPRYQALLEKLNFPEPRLEYQQ